MANIHTLPILSTPNYKIYVSNNKNKKYTAVLSDNTKVHFGDDRYQQYHDKLGYYKNLDHNDEKRKQNYYSRHGKLAEPYTAKYFSHLYLW